VGNVAIIKLPHELFDYKREIGKAILQAHKNIETVAMDLGVEGEERVRQIDILLGKDSTLTVHKEYGMELEVDLSKVYFSPRLASEHWRVAQFVKKGEVVLDMFCGVGPFAILIAKDRSPSRVYAIDINEVAIYFLKRNIDRNRVSRVIALKGDSRDLVPNLESVDRIIMNLPFSSFDFITLALSNIKDNGIIHYYEFLEHDGKLDRLRDIQEIAGNQNIEIECLLERNVHSYSPDSGLYCYDLKVKRGMPSV
jgi:tRNA (guanine37-N1)-methyltransferase